MKKHSLDNSIDADLRRVITWQYDHATRLIGVIGILKDFFKQSTEEFWNAFPSMIDIASEIEDTESEEELERALFAAGVWGRIMSVGRPLVKIGDAEVQVSIGLFRKILLGKFKLLNSDASIDAYQEFCNDVFGEGNVAAVDGQDMSIGFVWTGDTSDTDPQTAERRAVLEQLKDIVFVYPAGVKSHDQSVGPVFGFSEQVREDADGNQVVSTFVDVEVSGEVGTVIPSGSIISIGDDDYASFEDMTIGEDGKTVVRFACLGEKYVKALAVDGNVVTYDGEPIEGVTTAVNRKRSNTDFKIETLDNCTFAWNRN